jgi:hypothetical protein
MKAHKIQNTLLNKVACGRWWLFTACSLLTFIVSYIVAASYSHAFFPPSKKVLVLTLYTWAGPFAALVARWVPFNSPGSWIFGILGLFLVLLHPIKPRELTAIISLLGFVVWQFMGLVWVYVKI